MLDSISDRSVYKYEFMLLNDIYRSQEETFFDTSALFSCLESSYKNNFYKKSHLKLSHVNAFMKSRTLYRASHKSKTQCSQQALCMLGRKLRSGNSKTNS